MVAALLMALVALSTPPAPAADTVAGEEDLFALEEDLVTAASRVEDPVRLAPASVSLIKKSELRAFDPPTLVSALTGTRGVFPTDDRTYPTVGLRGFSPFGTYGNRIQVQLDGHILNGDW